MSKSANLNKKVMSKPKDPRYKTEHDPKLTE